MADLGVVDLGVEYKNVSVYRVDRGDLHSIQRQSCFGVNVGPPNMSKALRFALKLFTLPTRTAVPRQK